MSFIMILITAFALAMDACAVAICHGMRLQQIRWKHWLQFGCFFGFFQSGMTLIGYILGQAMRARVQKVDHWLAFTLLAIVGGRMIWEALQPDDSDNENQLPSGLLPFKAMIILAIATSLDALAVGIGFSVINLDLWMAVITIGAVAFVLSCIGVKLGQLLGQLFQHWAELVGGIVLIGIGIKIVIEHLIKGI